MKYENDEAARARIWPRCPIEPPPIYARASLSDQLPKVARGQSVVFTGPCGTGKSHNLFGLMNRFNEREQKRFENHMSEVPNLPIDMVEDAYGSKQDKNCHNRNANIDAQMNSFTVYCEALYINESDIESVKFCSYALAAYAEWPGTLLIDDLGYLCHANQMPDRWLQHFIYTIANERGNYALTTVYSTNMDKKLVAKYYGPHVASRIFSGITIEAGGDDRRQS